MEWELVLFLLPFQHNLAAGNEKEKLVHMTKLSTVSIPRAVFKGAGVISANCRSTILHQRWQMEPLEQYKSRQPGVSLGIVI